MLGIHNVVLLCTVGPVFLARTLFSRMEQIAKIYSVKILVLTKYSVRPIIAFITILIL